MAASSLLFAATAIAAPDILIYGGAGYDVTSPPPSRSSGTDFGAVDVSSTPVKSTFTIYNVGNQDLTISSIVVSGTAFQLSSAAPTVVPYNSTATFDVSFVAPSMGLQTGSVTVTSNDPDSGTLTFPIQGQGGTPKFRLTGKGLDITSHTGPAIPEDGTDFGTVSLGSSLTHTFTVSNLGAGDLTFSVRQLLGTGFVVDPKTITVPSGGTTNVDITFSPHLPTSVTGTIQFVTNDPLAESFKVIMTGNAGVPAMRVEGNGYRITSGDVDPESLDGTLMGETSIGLSDLTGYYMIINSGQGSLQINDIVLSDPVNFSAELLPNGATTISAQSAGAVKIKFHPTTAGTFNNTVTINSNDRTNPGYSFSVRATALSANLQIGGIVNGDTFPDVSDGTDFGDVLIGSGGVVHKFPVTNAGPGTLDLTSVKITPVGAFRIGLDETTLAPGQTVQLPVTFNPTAVGSSRATITIKSTSQIIPFTFDVKGSGFTRSLTVGDEDNVIVRGDTTPDAADQTAFGSVTLGQSSVHHIIPLRNTGSSPLSISSITSSNATEFAINSSVPATIAAGESANLILSFTPSGTGSRQSTITIKSNDPGSDYTFVVGGESQLRVDQPSTPPANPELTPAMFNKSFAGSFSGAVQGASSSIGRVDSFRLNPNGAFSAKGNVNGVAFTMSGKIDSTGRYTGNGLVYHGTKTGLDLKTYTGSDGSVHLIGSFFLRGVGSLTIDLGQVSGANIASAYAGTYTALIPADDTATSTVPLADGVASLSVTADGKVRCQYVLGDGTIGTRSAQLSSGGKWQLNFPVYGNTKAGSLSGEVTFRDVTGISDFDGTLAWSRTANAKSKLFPAGFAINRQIIGSRYTPASKGELSFPGLTAGTNNVTVSALAAENFGSKPATWAVNDRITGDKLALTVNRKTGMITGTYKDPATKTSLSLYGAVLQKQGLSSGLFKTTTQTGLLTIDPASN